MNSQAPVVQTDTNLIDALKIFHDRTVSGMAVVDPLEGRLCGIITTTDILRVLRVVLQIGRLSDPE
jgi:predicted transcriptional regulator